MGCDAAAISRALRTRRVLSDEEFDRLFPIGHRYRSDCHWTPVDVALRAAILLAPAPQHRILDVGSGVGKLCLIGALSSASTWVGIEQDAPMVEAARAAAGRLRVAHRCAFVQGDATASDWSAFDAVYMFNPFYEGLFRSGLGTFAKRAHYLRDVERARRQLATMKPGARVVTYHGFGGEMPPELELVHRETAHADRLCLWQRTG